MIPVTGVRRTPWGRVYVACVGLSGGVCLAFAVRSLLLGQLSPNWIVLAVLTWAAGWLAVKVPAIPATVYVSETFVFALVLLFGAGPAVVTVVADGALISLRRRDRDAARCLFNVAEPAVSVSAASAAFYGLAGIVPFARSGAAPPELSSLLLPVVVMATVYFLFNSWLTAVAVGFETGMLPQRVWRKHFMGLGLNTLGGALLGLLLALQAPSLQIVGPRHLADARILSGIGLVVPFLLISYLTFRTSVARVEDANRHLHEINRLYLSTVETLATAIDAKDQVTSHHIRRVQNYALSLAAAMGVTEESDLKAIEAAALLHDMGKLSVPEFILNKPGKLTPAEFERIKLHAEAGAHILSQIDFPYPVVPIVRHHHERWDGTGYPDGIAGEAIPLGARIMAVVDCFEALTSHRPYRRALSSEAAVCMIVERRGTAYDPRVVDAFVELAARDPRAGAPADAPASAPASTAMAATPSLCGTQPAHGRLQPRDSKPDPDAMLLLCAVAEGLAGRATLDDVAEAMGRHLRRMVPAPLVVFYLPDQAGAIVSRHASGEAAALLEGLRIPIGAGLSGWVAANRVTMANADPALDLGDRLAVLATPLESAVSTPLVSDGELIGVLTIYAAPRDAFTEDHRLLVEIAGRQIASAVAHAVRFDERRATDLKDPDTGLPNGRSLQHLIASAGFGGDASALSLGILCFVIGPDSACADPGDPLVRRMADASRRALRATDLVFRYSDDEIVILMPDTSPSTAARVAQRVAAGLLEGLSAAADLSVQIGMAIAPRDGVSIDALLEAARKRLARQRWRDVADGVPEPAPVDAGGAST
jgi:putative nucleotidyltransferase with HDIG domain/diguanylate cyclase (GGDEF)-like protein